VERYLDRFGAQVPVSSFEDFVADQPATVAAIHEFLGVGSTDEAAGPRRRNPASLPRNVLSGRILGSGRMRRLARATVPRPVRARLRGALLKEVSPTPMDPEARSLLNELFRPELERLARVLGTSPPWVLDG
jgi:hypothetical protein